MSTPGDRHKLIREVVDRNVDLASGTVRDKRKAVDEIVALEVDAKDVELWLQEFVRGNDTTRGLNRHILDVLSAAKSEKGQRG
ncbi:hypothetical protein GS854_01525 [Rhodococcus hoagii]|nr:hypothetical protein [Prescottella equi]